MPDSKVQSWQGSRLLPAAKRHWRKSDVFGGNKFGAHFGCLNRLGTGRDWGRGADGTLQICACAYWFLERSPARQRALPGYNATPIWMLDPGLDPN